MKFLEEGIKVSDIVVMIQKEVAERIAAPKDNKTYGSLSVIVQFYADAKVAFKVPNTVFIPQPNVESAVIRLKVLDQPRVEVTSRKVFFRTVKAAFSKRRKTLLNAVSSTMGMDKDDFKVICESVNIPPSIRAENMSVEDFGILANAIDAYEKKRTSDQ